MGWRTRVVIWTVHLAIGAGRASAPKAAVDEPGPAPRDFTIDFTVLDGNAPKLLRLDRRAPTLDSRFVLLPDGRLLGGTGTARGADWRPPPVRTLSRPQVQALWEEGWRQGLLDPAASDEAINFGLAESAPGERLYLLAITGHDRTWCFVRRADRDGPGEPALEPFLVSLRELSWGADRPEPAPRRIPERFDFGPDPYERFRPMIPGRPAIGVMVFAVTLAVLPILPGCVAADAVSRATGRQERTGGVAVEMLVRTGAESASFFRMDRFGVLHFGGGWDAINGTTTWSGPMTDEEIESLLGMLSDYEWYDARSRPPGQPAELSRTIRVFRDRRRNRFTVVGDHPDVLEVQALMQSVAERRLDPFLDTLPGPGATRP